jgi:hypothetical protein
MAVKTEETHRGEFLVSEANGGRSREKVTIESGQNLVAGAVLGEVVGGSISASADGGNTGDGTIGSLSVQSGAQGGDYIVTIVEPGTDAGEFTVEDPDGENVGTGTVGSQFTGGGIQFTLSDGTTDFVAGDRFTITVSGSGEYKEYDPTATDGSSTAIAVLYGPADASAAATDGTIITRDAEIDEAQLTWFDGATASQKTTGKAELAERGIITR